LTGIPAGEVQRCENRGAA